MQTILDLIRNDPGLSPTFAAALAPVWFRARCGRRRSFMSQADADAYDQGFSAYPNTPAGTVTHTPEWDGYFDAEQEQQWRDDAAQEINE